MTGPGPIRAGSPAHLGASVTPDGVNFAVFSAHATEMEVCLFDAAGNETTRHSLPEREGHVWHGEIPGVRAGQHYGLRAHGPFLPAEGHRFNPRKLLLDPYARALHGALIWSDALFGGTLHPDNADSADFMPKAVVTAALEPYDRRRPATPWAETVIYEAHVKGLTQQMPGVSAPGTFAGLASDSVLDHLTGLGVTAIELLPVHAFITDRFLHDKGLTNYWGYQSIGFFAPHGAYHSGGADEFRAMVARFHAAGIEVILDVVYNHTGEGDAAGPTLSLRGLDNASYYSLVPGTGDYVNDTGTGNTVNAAHPAVQRMIMDSLRYWVEIMGVDGFRFDLAATLGREADGFDPGCGLFDALRQDPALRDTKLVAEPWDIGPGGYRLGGFPHPFREWNDRFRDGVRGFWRGDKGHLPRLSDALAGSAVQFDHSDRPATASVNLVTAHDGFTLHDVVSYDEKHNEANGEGGRDGHGENISDNMGVEGPTDDPDIRAARARRKRNILATLFLAQGVPMLLAGDELGNTQGGNNNAYAQDNPTSWIDWSVADADLTAFTARLIALRRAHPVLRQTRFLHSGARDRDGCEDLTWRLADGREYRPADWENAALRVLCAEKRMAADTPPFADTDQALYLVFNRGPAETVTLPDKRIWREVLTTDTRPTPLKGRKAQIPANSVVVFATGAPSMAPIPPQGE